MFAIPAAGLMFPALFAMVFLGFPVAFSLIATALLFGYGIFGVSFGHQIFGRVVDVAGNFVLIQIPLFVFMGAIFEAPASRIASSGRCESGWAQSWRPVASRHHHVRDLFGKFRDRGACDSSSA